MAGFKTYDPAAHIITWGGLILGGFAKDKFLSAKRSSPVFKSQSGVTGEVVRSKINDSRGEIVFTAMASSSTNDALSEQVALDLTTGQGVAPFQIQDLNGTTLLHAPNAWISMYPDVELAQESGEAEWHFECDALDVFRGGLSPLG